MTKSAVYTPVMLLATILVAGQMLKSQVPATPPTDRQWEYASVTSGRTEGEGPAPGGPYQYFARAYTCDAASSGCGSSVTSKVEASDLSDVGTAMMKAASALGDDRWELVSVTSGANGDRVMYFRRPKTAQK